VQGFGRGTSGKETHLENLALDGRIMLKSIFKNQYGWAWTEFIWLRTETSG
jgi:hypothetical protein